MGKRRKGSNKRGQAEVYDSDDERAYSREEVPDPKSDSYYHDEIDQFHANKNKISLDRDLEPAGFSDDNKEEVLAVDSDEEDEEIEEYERRLKQLKRQGFKEDVGSDLEDEKDEAKSDDKAWGKKRSQFYGADVDDDEDIDFSGSEEDAALLEEKEALELQRKMAEEMDDGDFGLDIFKTAKKPKEKKEEEEDEKITKDLSKLSKREKLQLLKKESPELLELIEDYKLKMTELQQQLLPIYNLVADGKLPRSKGALYVSTKMRLYLNYCMNISFYLMMKAKHSPVQDHPVISRLVQYRNLIKQLESADARIQPELDSLLEKIRSGEEVFQGSPTLPGQKSTSNQLTRLRNVKRDNRPQRKLSEMLSESGSDDDEDEDDSIATGGRTWGRKRKVDARSLPEEKTRKKAKNSTEEEEQLGVLAEGGEDAEDKMDDTEEGDGKRAITKQIEKNRGLTPHRKKELRNPRVKHRMKYRKAKIRRKGQVREVRTEMHRYGGEISGIRAGIKRGVRLK